ncbi:hypothetical protein GPALN_004828 [Globodera pallida]|nr:hypothetical protein GPALN_004828 [Globodera pallida]
MRTKWRAMAPRIMIRRTTTRVHKSIQILKAKGPKIAARDENEVARDGAKNHDETDDNERPVMRTKWRAMAPRIMIRRTTTRVHKSIQILKAKGPKIAARDENEVARDGAKNHDETDDNEVNQYMDTTIK